MRVNWGKKHLLPVKCKLFILHLRYTKLSIPANYRIFSGDANVQMNFSGSHGQWAISLRFLAPVWDRHWAPGDDPMHWNHWIEVVHVRKKKEEVQYNDYCI